MPSLHQHLPGAIGRIVGDAVLTRDTVGESPCEVFHFERGGVRFFLKCSAAVYAPTSYSVAREAAVLDWLAPRLGVPELIAHADDADGTSFMVTRALDGEPLSAWSTGGGPAHTAFAEALRQLQAVDIQACPFDAGSAWRLRELDYLLQRGLIDRDADLQQWPDLQTPQALRDHLHAQLHATLPTIDPVFSHGDLGDSNVFVDAREQLSFIDLGRGGIADRWLDIAFVARHLREEEADGAEATFLAELGQPDQPQRRTWFEQLDELF